MVQSSLTAWLNKAKADVPAIPKQEVNIRHVSEKPEPQLPADVQPPTRTAAEATQHVDIDTKEEVIEAPVIQSPPRILRRPLPPNVEITSITSETLPPFKRLISLLLPIPYSDKFYKETLTDPVASSISLVALWHDQSRSAATGKPTAAAKPRVVAGIRCRLLSHSPALMPADTKIKGPATDASLPSIYLSTIATLSPYRSHGLATALLSRVIRSAIQDYGIGTVTAHVWEANTEGRAWYAKLGFREVRFEEQYYQRLQPSGAWVLERPVKPSDLMGDAEGGTG